MNKNYLSVSNLTHTQLFWLKRESERLGVAKAVVVKMMIQERINNDDMQKQDR